MRRRLSRSILAPEVARVRADAVEILSDTTTLTDLGTFYRRGGQDHLLF